MDIDRFTEKFRFLSNFYPAQVIFDNVVFPSTEHAFQAAKTLDLGDRRRIRQSKTYSQAKKLGSKVKLRPGWEGMKYNVMKELLRQKFSRNPLRERLLDTGDAKLVEGNTWGDRIWGVVDGVGANLLGKALMEIRDEIRNINGKRNKKKRRLT